MKLETIIGLEIHAQISSKTKLWCPCDNDAFGAQPNTKVCPVCMGFPGMLPVLNKMAVKKAFTGAAALGCTLQKFSKFDRKNYFYPDLPNGFQISQYDQPIALDGNVDIEMEGVLQNIGITRVHLENDAGKLTHEDGATFCDYNRSGTPLIEIVTEPDLRSPHQAQVFAKELQKILRFVNASDADMEKGMMRFDASISLRPCGETKLYARTEIKNLNSFAALKKALIFEQERQEKLWKAGKIPTKETTVGWLDDQGKTKLMREKESADDYRYFPEPDLPPLDIREKDLKLYSDDLPELPLAKFKRYREAFGLNENDALKLSESQNLSLFYEESVQLSKDPKKAANFILTEVLRDPEWDQFEKRFVRPQHIADVLKLIKEGTISASGGKTIIQTALKKDKSAQELMKDLGLEQNSDSGQLEEWVNQVLKENPQSIEDFKNGKDKALQFLMGQVMKLSRGSANPPLVMKMLQEKIQ